MRMMMAGLAIVAMAAPAAAQQPGVDDPRGFVAATYASYARAANAGPQEPTFAYSARLRALAAGYARVWEGGDLVGPLDFDLWTNAQEWEISVPALDVADEGPDRRTITARFSNYGRESVNRFRFVRDGGRWYLDDIVNGSGGGDDGWTFSAMLAERP